MSKTIYIAGASRTVDGVSIPKDKDKTGYERFVLDGTLPDGAVIPTTSFDTKQTYNAGDEIAAGTYLKMGASVVESSESLPAWIESVCVQMFTPSADTNEKVTFALTGMSGVPQVIIVGTTEKTPTNTRDFGGCICVHRLFDIVLHSSYDKWSGINFYKQTANGYVSAGSSPLMSSVSETSMTIQTPSWGSEATYWRAGQTYTVIALRFKDLT